MQEEKEKTSKKFKKHILMVVILLTIGSILFIIGVLSMLLSKRTDISVNQMCAGIVVLFIASVWGIINRMRIREKK